jgi:hypothetical protein
MASNRDGVLMGQLLHWAPQQRGQALWNLQLKRAIQEDYGLEGSAVDRHTLTLTASNLEYLDKLKTRLPAEGQREIEILVSAIGVHGSVEVWLR